MLRKSRRVPSQLLGLGSVRLLPRLKALRPRQGGEVVAAESVALQLLLMRLLMQARHRSRVVLLMGAQSGRVVRRWR
jgi:hypothetical protein